MAYQFLTFYLIKSDDCLPFVFYRLSGIKVPKNVFFADNFDETQVFQSLNHVAAIFDQEQLLHCTQCLYRLFVYEMILLRILGVKIPPTNMAAVGSGSISSRRSINNSPDLLRPFRVPSLGQFFCVGLGFMFYLLCLVSCLQTYVLRKMKTARFMLCLS